MLSNERRLGYRRLLADNPDWMRQGECRKHPDPPDAPREDKLWYPERDEMKQEARDICGRCPVNDVCEAYYMLTEEQGKRIGNAMGMTPAERRRFYRVGARPGEDKPLMKVGDIEPVKPSKKKRQDNGKQRIGVEGPRLKLEDFEAMGEDLEMDPEQVEALNRLIAKGYKITAPG